jgi:hypothetical protein
VQELEASGVDLNVLVRRLQRIKDSLQEAPLLRDTADNVQDVIDTVVRLRQFRD